MNKTNKAEIATLKLKVKYLGASNKILTAVLRNIYSERYPNKTPEEIAELWDEVVDATTEEISEDRDKLKELTKIE